MQSVLTAAALAVAAAAFHPAPIPVLKLDNVRILVAHFDDSFRFYRDVLGLQATWGKEGENYAAFVLPGGGQIALFRRELMAEALGTAHPTGPRTSMDTVALVLSTDDVDAVCGALQARGVAFESPATDQQAWGIRAAHFRDPDGNLIEIFSPLRKK